MKVNRFDITRLDNGAHGRFGVETLAAFEANTVIVNDMPELLAQYRRVVEQEEAVLVPYKGSPLTPRINAAEKALNAAWAHFKTGLRYYSNCEDADKVEAANVMLKWVKDYDVDRNAKIDRKVGLIQNFIFDCEGKLQAYVRTMRMLPEQDELNQRCEEANELLSERDMETGLREKNSVKAARRATDVVWQEFVEAINGRIILRGDEGMEELVAFINGYILRLKRTVFRQKTTLPTAGEDGNPVLPPADTLPGEDSEGSEGSESTEDSGGTGDSEGSGSTEGTEEAPGYEYVNPDNLDPAQNITVEWLSGPDGEPVKKMVVPMGGQITQADVPACTVPGYVWSYRVQDINGLIKKSTTPGDVISTFQYDPTDDIRGI